MSQNHDPGVRKRRTREAREERAERVNTERLAQALVSAGLCSTLILDSAPRKDDR